RRVVRRHQRADECDAGGLEVPQEDHVVEVAHGIEVTEANAFGMDEGHQYRTTRNVPAASRTIPARRGTVTVCFVTPRIPSWSTTTAVVSWPAIVAAVTPPAPSV